MTSSSPIVPTLIENVSKEVELARDGRDLLNMDGFFVGPTLFTDVTPKPQYLNMKFLALCCQS